MSNPIQSVASMDEWMQVLDRIQESINRALRETDDRELPAPESADGHIEQSCLTQIDERLRGLDALMSQAGQLAHDIEVLVAADEAETRAWVGEVAEIRRRLANLDPVGIS